MNKLYEADFFRWTQETADRLRRGEFNEIDIPALIEEVEDLGRHQRAALRSRLAILIAHLMKWDLQPGKQSRSWQATIELQRNRIERLLKGSPSLRPFVAESLAEAYSDAVLLAIKDTGFDRARFTTLCPYSLDEILRECPTGRF